MREYGQRFLAVALGGFVGGALRELLELLLNQPALPIGTLLINLTGTFLSVFLTSMFAKRWQVSQVLIDFVSVGILGAYTTYATLITELSTQLVAWKGFSYALVSILGSTVMVYLARGLAREVRSS